MKTKFDENKAKEALNEGLGKASDTLNDKEKSKKLLEDIERKLGNTKLKDMIEAIPLLISCLKSYIKGEFTEIPLGSMLAIVSALLYWVSPFDIIPDVIPGVGQIDDAAVVLACLAMVSSDLDDYKKWLDSKEAELDSNK